MEQHQLRVEEIQIHRSFKSFSIHILICEECGVTVKYFVPTYSWMDHDKFTYRGFYWSQCLQMLQKLLTLQRNRTIPNKVRVNLAVFIVLYAHYSAWDYLNEVGRVLTSWEACLILSTIPSCPRYWRDSQRGKARSFSTGWLDVRPAVRDCPQPAGRTRQTEWGICTLYDHNSGIHFHMMCCIMLIGTYINGPTYQGWILMSVKSDSGHSGQTQPRAWSQSHTITLGGRLDSEREKIRARSWQQEENAGIWVLKNPQHTVTVEEIWPRASVAKFTLKRMPQKVNLNNIC